MTTLAEAQARLADLEMAVAIMERERAAVAEVVHRLLIEDTLMRQRKAAEERAMRQGLRNAARAALTAAALAGMVTAASAQVLPTTYQMTRSAPGQPDNTFTHQASEMTCDLPRAEPTAVGYRIESPANPERDCQYTGPGNWSNLQAGVAYRFSLRGCNVQGQCGPSTALDTGVPGAPRLPRILPGFTGVAVNGTVRERYPFVGLDVARVWLDLGADLYLGARSLSTPGYTVQPGDRVDVVLQRPPQ